MLLQLLKDARVAQTYEELFKALASEVLWLLELPQHVWQSLSIHVTRNKVDPHELRAQSMQAALTAAGFFHHRGLGPASALPWSLASWSVAAKMDQLL